MAIRSKLEENLLDNVSGGVSYTNNWGDNTVYKVGLDGGEYTHTFLASDKAAVKEIINSIPIDRSLTPQQNDEIIMQALIDSPYLTPIE